MTDSLQATESLGNSNAKISWHVTQYKFVCYLVTLWMARIYSANSWMIDDYGAVGGERNGKETEVPRQNLPSASSSTSKPTWPDLGLNLGYHSKKLTTKLLTCGTVLDAVYVDKYQYHWQMFPTLQKRTKGVHWTFQFQPKTPYTSLNIIK
jgi:hypothetical protein